VKKFSFVWRAMKFLHICDKIYENGFLINKNINFEAKIIQNLNPQLKQGQRFVRNLEANCDLVSNGGKAIGENSKG
jgi:hypothetical protein